MRCIFADHSGQGGNWWTTVVLAQAAHYAGADVTMLVPGNYEQVAPQALVERIVPAMRWEREPRWRMQWCYAANERVARSWTPHSDGFLLISLVQFGVASGANLVQYLHNPHARALAGSERLGRVQQRWTTALASNVAVHGPTFQAEGKWLRWPHPVAPASLSTKAEQISLAGNRRNALCFGRASNDESLARVCGWLEQLPARLPGGLRLIISRSTPAPLDVLRRLDLLGVEVRALPRLEAAELDAWVAGVDAVLVPYEDHASSVTGVGLIATAAGTPIVAGGAIDSSLAFPPLKVAGRGAKGLRELLEGGFSRNEIIGQDALAAWGRGWVQMMGERF